MVNIRIISGKRTEKTHETNCNTSFLDARKVRR